MIVGIIGLVVIAGLLIGFAMWIAHEWMQPWE